MATTLPERTDTAHIAWPSETPMEFPGRNRRAWLGRKPLLVALIAAGAGLALFTAWTLVSDSRGSDQTLVFYTVKRGDLPITITESGTLQSQNTTQIKCEVESVGYEHQGTQILTIVENGKNVKGPVLRKAGEVIQEGDIIEGKTVKKGDAKLGQTVQEDETVVIKTGCLLVELDAARIQDRIDAQELATLRATSQQRQADVKYENRKTQNETNLAEAKLKVELAELALKQYEDEEGGTFQLDLQLIDLQIQTAEANRLIKATDLKGIEMLKKLGYRSKGDLEQARLAALSADKEVATAVSSRKELVYYTYRKKKMELAGAVETAKRALMQVERDNEAQLLQAEAAKKEADRVLAKEEEKLAKYRKQLENCKIYAPHDGMATYATEHWGGTRIEEGATVRERQNIITLPDLSVMEVKTGVHESVLDLIREGLPATITVDAFPDRKYKGSVKKVAVVADRGEWHSTDVKVYTTIVTIDEEVERLRPGMSAVVDIHVERIKDVLSVPVQAIVQVSDDNWCYVDANGSVELRRVTIGKTNDKFVEIREGFKEGDRVVLNPMSLVEGDQAGGKEIGPEGDSDQADEYGNDGGAQNTGESPSDKSAAKREDAA